MNKHFKQPASIKTQLMFHANLQKTFYLAVLLIYTTHCQWFFQIPHYKEHLHESSTFFQENSSFTAPSFSYTLLFAKSPCHTVQFSSVAQSCPTLCNPMNRKNARPPCPSPTPRVHPNPRPLCRWCHPTISSSVVPFSSCPQSFPASAVSHS